MITDPQAWQPVVVVLLDLCISCLCHYKQYSSTSLMVKNGSTKYFPQSQKALSVTVNRLMLQYQDWEVTNHWEECSWIFFVCAIPQRSLVVTGWGLKTSIFLIFFVLKQKPGVVSHYGKRLLPWPIIEAPISPRLLGERPNISSCTYKFPWHSPQHFKVFLPHTPQMQAGQCCEKPRSVFREPGVPW